MALRILLADDSMTAQNMGKKILAEAGYEVVTVSNGAAAIKKIAETTPDLVILDVYMPGYSGLEVCERLKASAETASLPILLTVGKMEPFRPEDGMKVKADGVIIKPFEATDLVTVISTLAGRVVPHAKTSQEQATSPRAAAAAAGQADTGLDNFAQTAAISAAVTTSHEADGLQTFTPSAEDVPSLAEPYVEFTSAPPVASITEEPLAALEPTIMAPPAVDESAEIALMSDFGMSLRETASSADEHSNWHVEEASLNEDELNLDLAAEMRAASSTDVTAAIDAVKSTITPPELDVPQLPPTLASARPIPAPIGKTSFDDFDAVMEDAAGRFETPPVAPATDSAPEPDTQPSEDFVQTETNSVEDFTAAVTQEENFELCRTEPSGFADVEPDLVSEDTQAESAAISAPALASVSALNGVFEMTSSSEESGVSNDSYPNISGDEVSDLNVASDVHGEHTLLDCPEPPAEPVQVVDEQAAVIVGALDEQDSDCENLMPVTEEHSGVTPEVAEPTYLDTMQTITKAECAQASVAEELPPAAIGSASTATGDNLDRIVERVLAHLKPALRVLVEEIVKEAKK